MGRGQDLRALRLSPRSLKTNNYIYIEQQYTPYYYILLNSKLVSGSGLESRSDTL